MTTEAPTDFGGWVESSWVKAGLAPSEGHVDRQRAPRPVPFEWFKAKEGKWTEDVVVLWVDEGSIPMDRSAALPLIPWCRGLVERFAEQIRLSQEAEQTRRADEGWRDGDARLPTWPIRIIGPSDSGALIRALRAQHGVPAHEHVRILSPFATIRDAKLFAAAQRVLAPPGLWTQCAGHDWLMRIPCTDTTVLAAVLHELRERRVTLRDREILLISELDSHYGRDVVHALDEAVATLPARERPVARWVTYLRGLDGHSTGSGPLAPTDPKRVDVPDGQGQLDSLRRLVDKVKAARRMLWLRGRDFAAVGVVGSDEYDKLLILQALRPQLRGLPFFTTDLDARYAHHSQIEWCRNLIVGSSFALLPQKAPQGPQVGAHLAPFRDSYTTSVYAATRCCHHRRQGVPVWLGHAAPVRDRQLWPGGARSRATRWHCCRRRIVRGPAQPRSGLLRADLDPLSRPRGCVARNRSGCVRVGPRSVGVSAAPACVGAGRRDLHLRASRAPPRDVCVRRSHVVRPAGHGRRREC